MAACDRPIGVMGGRKHALATVAGSMLRQANLFIPRSITL